MQRRESLRSMWLGRRRSVVVRWVVLSVLFGLGWLGLLGWGGSTIHPVHVWVAAVPLGMVMISLLILFGVSRSVGAHDGELLEACWSDSMVLLCLPWLSALPVGVGFLALIWVCQAIGMGRGMVSLVTVFFGMLIILAWLLSVLVGMLSWYVKISELSFEYWVHERTKAGFVLRVLGTLLMGPSVVSGIVMGATSLDLLSVILG